MSFISGSMLIGDVLSLYITNFSEPFGSDLDYSRAIEKMILITISTGDVFYDFWLVIITLVISFAFGWKFLVIVAFYAFSLGADIYEIYLTLLKYKKADDKTLHDKYI